MEGKKRQAERNKAKQVHILRSEWRYDELYLLQTARKSGER